MTMEIQAQAIPSKPRREPWNKGKLIGQKPPLRPKHVWSIRTRLQMEGRTRDLAMFNLAIDSKLRGCDVVALRVEDVAPSGYAVDRATVRQKKTGRPVTFELTEQTRQAVDDYIKAAGKKPGEFLFSGRGDHNRCMTTRQYARLVSSWVQLPASTRTFSARIRFGVPKRHSSTVEPATYVPCSCCWDIRRSRALSGISALRSTMPSP
jgi:integrase